MKRIEDMTPEERFLDKFVYDCGLKRVEEPTDDDEDGD